MPLSKCRYCGKMIPNPYRKHHEEYQCVMGKISRGEDVSEKARANALLQREVHLRNEHLKSLQSPLFADYDKSGEQ